MTTTADTSTSDVADALEARARRLMAERAGMPLTWETRGRRAELLVEINAALAEFNQART